jgi:predicted alpha/beta superfamily hydrolase
MIFPALINNRKKLFKFFVIVKTYLFISLLTVLRLNAQQVSPLQDSLYSDNLKETRYMHVYLPKDYKAGETFDVLYVLDAADNEDMAVSVAQMASEHQLIPHLIIVCIPNKWLKSVRISSRERDFEPTWQEGFPISGGADKFIAFLKNELLPYFAQKYGRSGKKLLFGHSLSGLFTLYTLLSNSDIFDFYIASDPSLWWDDGYVNKMAENQIETLTSSKHYLYMAGRSGEMYATQGLLQMEIILQKNAPLTLKWASKAYENEHHGSVSIKTLYDGLKFYYFGYLPWLLEYYPMNGILLPGKPVNVMTYFTFLDYQPGVRYTSDGTDPNTTSPKLEWGITINPGAELRIKLFSTTGIYDKEVSGHFAIGKLFPAEDKPITAKPGGMRYTYNDGTEDNRQLKSGIADKEFSISNFSDTAKFTCQMEGYLEIQKTGYYTFVLNSDQSAQLFINNHLLIEVQSGLQSFVLPLEKGFHPIRLNYQHELGKPTLDLSYVNSAIPGDGGFYKIPISIPLTVLYSE